jgi:hypothetical protein
MLFLAAAKRWLRAYGPWLKPSGVLDIVENRLPGAIISEPKMNIEYVAMDCRVLCNISLRGANILSGCADILFN